MNGRLLLIYLIPDPTGVAIDGKESIHPGNPFNVLRELLAKQDLDSVTCQNVVNAMLEPGANQLQIAAFLVLLRSKSETAEG